MQLGRLDAALVREWRADLLAAGVSESAAAKAYRLLRAVMNTAADDRIVYRNPCQIKGADRERPAERPVLTAPEVFALAAAVPARFRAMVLVAAFGSLRFGEVIALRRRDIDLDTGTITITRAYVEARGIGPVIGPPKSAAGRRTVTIPAALVDVLREHMAAHVVDAGADALVFTGPTGAVIRRGNFRKLTKWTKTVADLGLAGVHFHDLRHTGNVWAARSGVSTRDLMARMGHDSMRAALIYQHVTTEADERIAATLDAVWSSRAMTPDR